MSTGKNVVATSSTASETNAVKVYKQCKFCNKDLTLTQAKINEHETACETTFRAIKAEEERRKAEVEAKLQRKRELAAAQNPPRNARNPPRDARNN